MAEFTLEKSAPFESRDLPVSLGAARLEAVSMGAILAILPLKGQSMAVAKVMKAAVGATLPKVGEVVRAKGAELIWFAQGQWLVLSDNDVGLTDALHGVAAVSDQSDGWAVMQLSGADAEQVLARLCPLDFDDLPIGRVARSDFAHVSAVIIPRAEGYWICIPRSFAGAVVESTVDVMKSLAAQALL